MNKKKTIAIAASVIALLGASAAWVCYSTIKGTAYKGKDTAYIYIDYDDNQDSVLHKLAQHTDGTRGFEWLCKAKGYNVRTGRYPLHNGEDWLTIYRRLRSGSQEATEITIPSSRYTEEIVTRIADKLMLSKDVLMPLLSDSIYLLLPNTYQVYWDISADKLIARLQKERNTFWNEDRLQKAASHGLTPNEVVTLASIVDEESAYNPEKPTIAGLYLNRLHKGMLLQSDPTVKYALGDWSLKRIYNKDLEVDNPYNTYRYQGLPPGPIRVPSIEGIEAVLNAENHNYLYMCANDQLNGTHNFAVTYNEHLANAKRYAKALNERGIK